MILVSELRSWENYLLVRGLGGWSQVGIIMARTEKPAFSAPNISSLSHPPSFDFEVF